jgi:hypothetical protein
MGRALNVIDRWKQTANWMQGLPKGTVKEAYEFSMGHAKLEKTAAE